jgi:catechol 2,3-dioxygenase-like lactoylglutathione lyase family enzyme
MGGSAAREAARRRQRAAAHEFAARLDAEAAARFEVASRTEERIAAEFRAMEVWGWRSLVDRRWPGTRRANIDLVAVGPAGVLVVDVKAWAEPRIEAGRLYRGQADAHDELDKLLRLTALVEELSAAEGLAPELVIPLIVLAGHSWPATAAGRVRIVGETRLAHWVATQPPRAAPDRVAQLAAALDTALPPYDEPADQPVSTTIPEPPLPRAVSSEPRQLAAVDVDELERALLAAEAAKPIEEWMTFLHPIQAGTVRRTWLGPARIRGPAGTGKTVVALHRAAYLATTRPGRVLVTGFVRTLPAVLGNLYRQLSPTTADRVEFTGLNAWAKQLLDKRGVRTRLDTKQAADAWRAAWAQAGGGVLTRLVGNARYWQDEVDHVIKARGLLEYGEYAAVERVGRKVPLRREHKAAVWDLYLAYQRRLTAAGLHDFNDILAMAYAEVQRAVPDYAAVIVDEVTDLNLLGLRLVRRLAGDRPDALLLVGDGRQAVYPGGARLREAGIDVTGRAIVLRINYRNSAAVLAAARELAPTVPNADPSDTEEGYAAVARSGGQPAGSISTGNVTAHDQALLAAVRTAATRLGGYAPLAVLCRNLADVDRYLALLRADGIPCLPLTDYAGLPVDRVKVGTYKRAKGLDFGAVLLPRVPRPVDAAQLSDPAAAERAELTTRELHVAATRARDELWTGRLGW